MSDSEQSLAEASTAPSTADGSFSRAGTGLVQSGVTADGGYNSCFYVPPPARNVVRIYHNRKKTSFTEHVIEDTTPPTPSLTLLQMLELEANPTRAHVCQVAYAEGDSTEDSSLAAVLETPNAHGWVPLLVATRQRQADAVAALLSLGAKVNCQDPDTGCTPLIIAVTNGDQDIVHHLLAHGADVNVFSGPQSRNALCEAIFSRRSDVVDLLLAAGGDPELVRQCYPTLAEALTRWHKNKSERICTSSWMGGYWSALLGFRWHMVMPAGV